MTLMMLRLIGSDGALRLVLLPKASVTYPRPCALPAVNASESKPVESRGTGPTFAACWASVPTAVCHAESVLRLARLARSRGVRTLSKIYDSPAGGSTN